MAKNINYNARSFDDYKQQLNNFTKQYYPEIVNDFNDASIGQWFVDLNSAVADDLGHYMTGLLNNFKAHLDYYDPDTTVGQDEITVSGGHGGIGSISNVFGTCEKAPYTGLRFIDMFKNKIINDLSGVKFNLSLRWSEKQEYKAKEPEMDNKVLGASDVTKIDKFGKIIPKNESYDYQIKDKDGNTKGVSRDEFVKAGLDKGMKPNEIQIDNDNKIVIAKFEKYNNK